jgi:hypothetical protein
MGSGRGFSGSGRQRGGADTVCLIVIQCGEAGPTSEKPPRDGQIVDWQRVFVVRRQSLSCFSQGLGLVRRTWFSAAAGTVAGAGRAEGRRAERKAWKVPSMREGVGVGGGQGSRSGVGQGSQGGGEAEGLVGGGKGSLVDGGPGSLVGVAGRGGPQPGKRSRGGMEADLELEPEDEGGQMGVELARGGSFSPGG